MGKAKLPDVEGVCGCVLATVPVTGLKAAIGNGVFIPWAVGKG